jgi:hypothetical protein
MGGLVGEYVVTLYAAYGLRNSQVWKDTLQRLMHVEKKE